MGLLERNQAVIGIVVTVVIAVATVFSVGLSGGAFDSGIPITAYFEDAAALESGDFVYVAGIRSGKVKTVEVHTGPECDRPASASPEEKARTGCVEVGFLLTAEGVPVDSSFAITVENVLGRRGINVVPGTSPTRITEDFTVEMSTGRTSTPVDVPELGDRTVELLDDANVDALQALTTALADITEDARQDVTELMTGLDKVADIVVNRKDEIARALDRAEAVAVLLEEKDTELITVIDEFGFVVNRLAERRDDITRLLQTTADATGRAATLVEDRRSQIDRILAEVHADLEIIDRHQIDLAHAFAYFGVGFQGFASIGYAGAAQTDNPGWGNVFVTSLGAGSTEIADCGGPLDELLTQLVGPDPTCEEEDAVAASTSEPRPLNPVSVRRSFGNVFTAHLQSAGAAATRGGAS